MTFEIEKTIGFALHHGSYVFKAAMKAAFADEGYEMTPEEFVTLYLIPDAGIDQTELVRKSLKEKTNITRLLTRMTARGWIAKVGHASSGRQQTVVLTNDGSKIKTTLLPLVQKMVQQALEGVSEEDIHTTTRTLMRLIDNLSGSDPV